MARIPGQPYVYLLLDPRKRGSAGIFYVGKGKNLRAADHEPEAIRELKALAANTDDEGKRVRLTRKLDTIASLRAAGQQVQIEILAGNDGLGLQAQDALLVESGLIAALRMTELGNRIAGHGVRLLSRHAFTVDRKSGHASLPDGRRAVIVPVKGVWGGVDVAGTLTGSAEAEKWHNAHRLWSKIAPWRVEQIQQDAATLNPVLLIALGRHPNSKHPNLVVGVWELQNAICTDEPKGGNPKRGGGVTKEGLGWIFERRDRPERRSTLAVRKALVDNILCDNGTPKERPQDRAYLGDW